MTPPQALGRALKKVQAKAANGSVSLDALVKQLAEDGHPAFTVRQAAEDRERVNRALHQALTNECAKRGGYANMGIDGLISVNVVIDPDCVIAEIRKVLAK